MSDFQKRKNAITILHEISIGGNTDGKWQQVTNLGKHGYIKIKPGRKLELTEKGKSRASLYSDNPETFNANVMQLLQDKLKREPFIPGTMPLFYADCTECEKQKAVHKAWVLEDCKAIKDGSSRTAPPVLEKHIH